MNGSENEGDFFKRCANIATQYGYKLLYKCGEGSYAAVYAAEITCEIPAKIKARIGKARLVSQYATCEYYII